MTVSVTPHLNFRGEARAALDFYGSVFGGDVVAVTYGDFGQTDDPILAKQIVWGQVTSGQGVRVMAYDAPPAIPHDPGQNAFFVSVRGADAEEIRSYWKGLTEGGEIVLDLAPAAWSPLYGMVRDRFGVTWVLDVDAARAA